MLKRGRRPVLEKKRSWKIGRIFGTFTKIQDTGV